MSVTIRHSAEFKRRILIISSNQENRDALTRILSCEYDIDCVSGGAEALKRYSETTAYALNILDLDLPDMNAYAFIGKFRSLERVGRIPIIAIMARTGSEARTLRAGAADFIRKPFQEEVILARCDRIIDLSVDQSLIRRAQDDELTGLYNREFFFEYVRQIEQNLENPVQDAVVINIEHFHLVNELYGRQFGDQVLRRLADAIRKMKAQMESIACRTDADSFYIYCKHQPDYEEIVRDLVRDMGSFSGSKHIRLRVGIYQNVDPMGEPEVWFDRAKKACDLIREDYTRNISYYDSKLYERTIYEEKLIRDIHDAINENRIIVYYQPKFDITGENPRLCGAEALVRWAHPEFGIIAPDDFIPLFEKNGLILKLDRFVWTQVARQVRIWRETYNISIPVSVNVSHIDIYDENLVDGFRTMIEENGLEPSMMHLEITESAYAEDSDRLLSVVNELRQLGFLIEMDDFGTGYSSLNMLSVLPLDVIKLDREFIRNMGRNEKGARMVELVLDVARFLKVPCIAEGVESEEEYSVLRKMNCDIIQGYYFSHPLTLAAFDCFLEKELRCSKRYTS
ncbi:MAG: EAL domain-containing protein [Clostridia bacterium]|nr:EAL domain-containing protein [Clostridia bacterium]